MQFRKVLFILVSFLPVMGESPLKEGMEFYYKGILTYKLIKEREKPSIMQAVINVRDLILTHKPETDEYVIASFRLFDSLSYRQEASLRFLCLDNSFTVKPTPPNPVELMGFFAYQAHNLFPFYAAPEILSGKLSWKRSNYRFGGKEKIDDIDCMILEWSFSPPKLLQGEIIPLEIWEKIWLSEIDTTIVQLRKYSKIKVKEGFDEVIIEQSIDLIRSKVRILPKSEFFTLKNQLEILKDIFNHIPLNFYDIPREAIEAIKKLCMDFKRKFPDSPYIPVIDTILLYYKNKE